MTQITNVVDATKNMRTKATRKSGDRATKLATDKTAKSKDASKTKVSFYLDADTADKLFFKARLRRIDQSDLVNEILKASVSSVVCYDQKPTKTDDSTLLVSEIGKDAAA